MPDVSLEARHVLVCGDTGSGKSAWTKQQIARARRVLVWDVDDEYSTARAFERLTTRRQLVDAIKRRRVGRFAFVPDDPATFDFWSRAAFAWGNCIAVAEEIADVTSPGKAPPGWGRLIRRGRKYGISVYGLTQRPAESDKTILTQAAAVHIGMMPDQDSIAYVARRCSIDPERIAALGPLEWLHWVKATREITSGRLRIPRKK